MGYGVLRYEKIAGRPEVESVAYCRAPYQPHWAPAFCLRVPLNHWKSSYAYVMECRLLGHLSDSQSWRQAFIRGACFVQPCHSPAPCIVDPPSRPGADSAGEVVDVIPQTRDHPMAAIQLS